MNISVKTQNLLLVILMIVGLLLTLSGETYIYGIGVVFGTALFSLMLILRKKRKQKKKITFLTWLAIVLWLCIPASFFLVVSGSFFGSGLDALFNWAKLAIGSGILAILMTSVELFRTRY